MNAGFDYVYVTVSTSYTDGQVWIVRHGHPAAIPGLGKGSVSPVPRPDGKVLLVKRLVAQGGPDGGGLAVIDLTGRLITAVPNTPTCFPGGLGRCNHDRHLVWCPPRYEHVESDQASARRLRPARDRPNRPG